MCELRVTICTKAAVAAQRTRLSAGQEILLGGNAALQSHICLCNLILGLGGGEDYPELSVLFHSLITLKRFHPVNQLNVA